ncbi:hypothetical protein ACFFWE_25820 [Sphaerisporangium melleum]|uniref:hypothetical protein n=1 Tax=Sphaerisporangium melleum TaxID=321316 RepID=UPI001667D66F|nr:hypothetical protein [Sphaerisporangium melleum]
MINQQIPAETTPNGINLNSSEPATEAADEKPSALALLERIASVVLPIGVGLYAVLYLGVEAIYGIFGVTPQQAGIDQAVLFGRLSGTLILLLLIALPVLGLLVALYWVLDKVTFGRLSRLVRFFREHPWMAATLAALWSGATYWGAFSVLGEVKAATIVPIAVGLGVLTFLVPFRLMRRRPVGRAGMRLVVGALTGIGLGWLLIYEMVLGAADVYTKGTTSDLPGLEGTTLLDLVGFQSQWAVLMDGDDKPLYDSRSMLLLGESNGVYAFYDCDKMVTIRRAADHTNLGEMTMYPELPKDHTCGSQVEQDGQQDAATTQ